MSLLKIFDFMMKLISLHVMGLLKRILAFYHCDPWINYSWSQEGEDQILRRIFGDKSKGFYVDVGAHHPRRFSNTYLFYARGWNGLNIDAMPGSMKSFDEDRPRDINLEIGIGSRECQLDYFVFNETALNGFSKELSDKRHDSNSLYQIKEIIKVNVLPLSMVLDSNLPVGQIIDFMSVDVEGLDFEVLKSNDWTRYRPRFVLAEILTSSLNEIEQSRIGQLMINVGYVIYAKSVNTVFFKAVEQ
jgi:FkbM family methyltransferase